jgi:hypothetical protein
LCSIPLIAVILQAKEYCGALHILHGLQLYAAGLPGGQSYLSAFSLLSNLMVGVPGEGNFDSSLSALFSLEVVVA